MLLWVLFWADEFPERLHADSQVHVRPEEGLKMLREGLEAGWPLRPSVRAEMGYSTCQNFNMKRLQNVLEPFHDRTVENWDWTESNIVQMNWVLLNLNCKIVNIFNDMVKVWDSVSGKIQQANVWESTADSILA